MLVVILLALLGSATGAPAQPARQAAPAGPIAAAALPYGLPDDLAAAATILAAEDRRSLDQELLRLTRSSDSATRARAALAVGRVGMPAGYPRLVEMLRDPQAPVRALAAFGLGLLELDLEPATVAANRRRISERLVAAIDDPEPLVAAQALWALGMHADAASVPAVAAVLDGDGRDTMVLEAALDAWWRLPDATPAPLRPHLRSADVAVRRAAALALRRLDNPDALPSLAAALRDPDGRVRSEAIRGLRQAPPTIVGESIVALLRDDDWRVMFAALGWVQQLWSGDADLDPEVEDEVFTAVLTDSGRRQRHVQRAALAALAAAPGRFSVVEDRLDVALRSGDAVVRLAALDALGSAPERADDLIDAVLEVYGLDAPPREGSAAEIPAALMQAPVEAASVARVLGAAGGDRTDDWLRLLLAHGPVVARAEALRQMQRSAPDEASLIAAAWLRDGDPVLRAVAAEVAGAMNAAGTLRRPEGEETTFWADLLWTAQRELGEAGALEPRLVALDTLRTVDRDLLQLRAAALLPDPQRVIRTWALRNLASPQRRAAELTTAAPGALETGRSAADYRRLAQQLVALQQDPPMLEVETARGTFAWQLRPDLAPLTTLAYLEWISSGFYDGVLFHRVVPDFVVQAGDSTAVGYGGAPGSLRSEETPLPFEAGTVGLALAGRDTGGSQFFIADSPQPHLRGRYPVLGQVVENARYVERIQAGDALRIRRR